MIVIDLICYLMQCPNEKERPFEKEVQTSETALGMWNTSRHRPSFLHLFKLGSSCYLLHIPDLVVFIYVLFLMYYMFQLMDWLFSKSVQNSGKTAFVVQTKNQNIKIFAHVGKKIFRKTSKSLLPCPLYYIITVLKQSPFMGKSNRWQVCLEA